MRLLILSRYDALGASSRLRMLQYVPALCASGFDVDVQPLLDDRYVRGLYAGRIPIAHVVRLYFRRLRCLLSPTRYDIVWVEKELFPWMPAWLEKRLVPKGAILVVDYDDAVFHRYDMHGSSIVRSLLGGKIAAVMRRADMVTAGNDYLADYARHAGCRRVEWLPTVIDMERYPERPAPATETGHEQITIGWIGSPATGDYLRTVDAALRELRSRHAFRCVAIGARADQITDLLFEQEPWSEATEAAQLRQFDIGIMPLPDAPWERGKCGYKLIQYMACGLPVVASPVGANRRIVVDGDNGFLASNDRQWVDLLDRLISDPGLRERMGMRGRCMVEESYCMQVQAPRLASMLHDIVGGGSH
ncbi:MAG: glycosyltransferase family 4 protein [Lysobacteraceae bacterium]